MGYKTGKEPDVDDGFVWRICHALDQKPTDLARNIGVSFRELKPFMSVRHPSELGDTDMDEVWFKLEAYIGRNIGMLLAVRHELNKTLQTARVQRVARTERFKAYHAK